MRGRIKTIGQRAFELVLGAAVVACGGHAATSAATGTGGTVPSGGTSSGGAIAVGFGGFSVATGGTSDLSIAGSPETTTGGGSGGSVGVVAIGGAGGAVNPPINVLVFNYTTGYGHQARETGIPFLQTAAAANDINLDLKYAILKDPSGNFLPEGTSDLGANLPVDLSAFTPGGLDQYDVVYFLNTTGHVFQGTAELVHQQALQDYMEQHHGGFVGTHSATDTYDEGWPWYQDMIGSLYQGTQSYVPGSARWNDGVTHAILTTAMVPNPWARSEEWYYFKRDVSTLPGFTVLLLASKTGTPQVPSAWVHELAGGGRVFYTAFGHSVDSFRDPAFMAFLISGIKWAAHRL